MDQEKTVEQVKAHVNKQIEKLNTPNKIWLSQAISICKPWYGNPEGFLFKAARQAIQQVFQVDPDFTREGCSIPIALDFDAATQSPTILIPMGASDDGAHWFWGGEIAHSDHKCSFVHLCLRIIFYRPFP